MRFWKYEGIGNDFIVLDGEEIDRDLCRRMCDRNFGIGADGVLYILPGRDGSDVTMRIINADGSEAEMCGNGIRCVAKHVYDNGTVKKKNFTINTLRGNLGAEIFADGTKAKSVKIDMGAPILEVRGKKTEKLTVTSVEADNETIDGYCVSMGNPHFVVFEELSEEDIDRLGPMLESHPAFPKKTNVEFVRVKDGKIHVRVYERGAAWTLACGTGACASATAAALKGLVPFGKPVDVHLPGGWLKITVDKELNYVHMEGPATFVFEGEYRK